MKTVEAFTDGSCLGNPGPGGWGVLLRTATGRKELSGGLRHTTNNAMELTAVIVALEALHEPCRVDVTTDSQYVKNGAERWMRNWKRNNWRTGAGEEVKNVDLWRRLDPLLTKHSVKFHWVKGHAGHAENERVDTLAQAEARKFS